MTHDSGPLFVLAGPGSGKTRVITRHIAYRINQRKAVPNRILALTFTNRAAEEMRRRILELLNGEAHIPIGTFHWMCSALLRRYADRLELRRDFRLLDASEARSVVREVAEDGTNVMSLARALSAVKNGATLDDVGRTFGFSVSALTEIAARYDNMLRTTGGLDLDDLLRYSAQLLRTDAALRRSLQQRFDVVLVDEFQDTNPVQAEIVNLLSPLSRTVIAVGDDDQAIYEWRQASGGAALFHEAFPDSETVVLGESYRHTKRILRAAASLIDHNPRRTDKRLTTRRLAGERPVHFVARDEADEADWVAQQIASLLKEGFAHADIGVLYRVHAQSRALEDSLVRQGIPYRVLAGRRFYERPEIQRALAYLRLALDPASDAAAEVLVRGVPGIGDVRLDSLRRRAMGAGTTMVDALKQEIPIGALPTSVATRLAILEERIRSVLDAREQAVSVVVQRAVDVTRMDLEGRIADRDTLNENLDELVTVARQFGVQRGMLRELVDRMNLQPDEREGDGGVSLLSLHAAKGLEFGAVFVTGLEEGLLPHRRAVDRDADVEAERRLAYVGVTRARDRLFLSHAQMRFLGGHAFSGGESRFLAEMGRANLTVERSRQSSHRPRLTSVTIGERVEHSRWGSGTVLSIEGRGRDTLITVQFDSEGRKRLQLCHAPLLRRSREERARVC